MHLHICEVRLEAGVDDCLEACAEACAEAELLVGACELMDTGFLGEGGTELRSGISLWMLAACAR